MTENLQADCVQSRQAGFIQCFPKKTLHEAHLTALCNVSFVCEIPIRQSDSAALLIFSEI